MLRKKSRFLILVLLHLTVAMLLSVAGAGFAKSHPTFKQRLARHTYIPTAALAQQQPPQQEQEYAEKAYSQHPVNPAESPNKEEEIENKSTEERDGNHLFLFSSCLYFYNELLNSPTTAYSCYQQLVSNASGIPLYILFHSWKIYLS